MWLRAFLRRDLREELSYRLYAVMQGASMVFGVLGLLFLGRMVGRGTVPALDPWGGEYFLFAVTGVAVGDAMWVALSGFAARVRYDQMVGTLDAMLATPAPLGRLVLGSGAYPLCKALLRLMLYLVLGYAFSGTSPDEGALLLLLILPLTFLGFGALGVVSAALTLVVKRGEPVGAFAAVSFLVAGTLYPVETLPGWCQAVASVLPLTHAIDATRAALLSGASLAE
ncbi:MAG: ABC transporter permease, partial [Deltaproteobacteria bacterium]|nr:ABC transporter permease [Deltaproteobacteria bacterium]